MTPLEVARREVGVRESGSNGGVPAERYNDGEAKPWCAAFVRYCFESANLPLPGNRHRLPSVAYLEEQLELAGARIERPEAGAIITFATRVGSDAGRGRHVGIVELVGVGGLIRTIEGNSGDRVARRAYTPKDPRISGFFRWPV